MSDYNVRLQWQRTTPDFQYPSYDRRHTVYFYGGPKIDVSSSANLLRNPQYQAPEELLVASVASCFLLTFLALCCKQGYVVDHYSDHATCILDENIMAVSEVILRPEIRFQTDNKPDDSSLQQLFKEAHTACFIANTLKATLSVNPVVE
ncbi:OsmC family peroxiredoxin [Legionella sp. MW5194]|uniref:OsmC family protein n=1 Tax=Legionella sp. MW5194 TaxID=2662448 RepID=UPI00193E0693|nr:OsmC family protein [Legionella sp. MW5194]QRN04056.1 OsmC family peroxiredoxin [Legionella sp. MW5194]